MMSQLTLLFDGNDLKLLLKSLMLLKQNVQEPFRKWLKICCLKNEYQNSKLCSLFLKVVFSQHILLRLKNIVTF